MEKQERKRFTPEQARGLLSVSEPYTRDESFVLPLEGRSTSWLKHQMGPHVPELQVPQKLYTRIMGPDEKEADVSDYQAHTGWHSTHNTSDIRFSKIELEKDAGISIGESKVSDVGAAQRLRQAGKGPAK